VAGPRGFYRASRLAGAPEPLDHRARREIFPLQGFSETILRGAGAGLLLIERPDNGSKKGVLPPF
jgi:hypothetical protein